MKKFAFLIHPLDMIDVIRHEPKAANKSLRLVEKVLEWMPTHKRSDITGIESPTGAKTEGWFILMPLMPHQIIKMERQYVIERIMQGVDIAADLGADIIGLGGYTSVVGDAGITIAKRSKIAVTSGNSYTIATSLQGALKAAKIMNLEIKDARVAVVGASGSIGKACAQYLLPRCKSMVLIARAKKRLEKLVDIIKENYGKDVSYTTDISKGIRDADIVITATSSAGNIIMADDLKPGAVVCDVSLPHDVARDVQKLRPDVLVIEGGVVQVPGENVNFGYDFGYPPNVSLACMAETIILALEEKIENYSLGRGIKLEKVEEITRLSQKHGFQMAGFRSFEQFITEDKIKKIKENADAAKIRAKSET